MYLLSSSAMNFLLGLLFSLAMSCHGNTATENESLPSENKYELHHKCLKEIQKQVNEEMHASLVYANMAAHFDHNSVGKKGFTKFFAENSKEEREHAQKLINYINRRGGRFQTFDITMPTKGTWDSGLEALTDALALEMIVNNKLHHLHNVADKQCHDPHLMDYLESEFLDEQVESIDMLKRYISIIGGMEKGIGEYLFDRQLLGEKTEL